MVKKTNPPSQSHIHKWSIMLFISVLLCGLLLGCILSFYLFEQKYADHIYPGVRIDTIDFGGQTPNEVESYFTKKSLPFANLSITLVYENNIATISGHDLDASFDAKLSRIQAFSIGRSGDFLSDTYQKWQAATSGINLQSVFRMNSTYIDDLLASLSLQIDLPTQDALFQFEKGKVSTFRLSKPGRHVALEQTKQMILSYISAIGKGNTSLSKDYTLTLPVLEDIPKIATENSNNYGIKELIGIGTSRFHHSIPGRVHNVELAASRIHGHLIAPGAVFSFNDALGDVSAATGFQPAYIIKEGRTVLGDGGGVCQVSTTLFRAALNSGLPIVERHAHAYRVSYYEEESLPGIDATVFAPGYDLKIKNDTGNYILIQAKIDTENYALAFELFGTKDGRTIDMTKPVLYGQSAPPPELYQDDPTIPAGVVKQVDWSAWGGKTNFDYLVTKDNEILSKETFYSNYRPWQAVFLRGTKT